MNFSTSSSQTESVYNGKTDEKAEVKKVIFTKQNLQKFFEELEKN